jgi:septal ring factor EnvC (AmiA/AmiB activator)
MDSRLVQMDDRFAQMDSRLVQMDDRFAQMDSRFARMDSRFAQVDDRFAKMDDRFAQIEDRLSTIDRKIDAQGVMLRTEILTVAQMVATNTESIALLRRDIDDLRTRR